MNLLRAGQSKTVKTGSLIVDIRREEVALMIESAESRIAASVARMEERYYALAAMMAERDRRTEADMAEYRADVKNLRRTIIVTGISATLAILFGIGAIASGLLAHFQGGVETGTRLAAEHEAMRQDLREIKDLLREQRRPPMSASPADSPKK